MTADRDVRADLEPHASEDVIRLAEKLERERPVPNAAFRGGLRRRLLGGGTSHIRPKRLRLLIGGYATAGSLLLVVGVASVAGTGPLAA